MHLHQLHMLLFTCFCSHLLIVERKPLTSCLTYSTGKQRYTSAGLLRTVCYSAARYRSLRLRVAGANTSAMNETVALVRWDE